MPLILRVRCGELVGLSLLHQDEYSRYRGRGRGCLIIRELRNESDSRHSFSGFGTKLIVKGHDSYPASIDSSDFDHDIWRYTDYMPSGRRKTQFLHSIVVANFYERTVIGIRPVNRGPLLTRLFQ